MDDPLDSDEHGGDELDDSCLVVRTIYIFGMDQFWEVVTWEFVSFNKSSIKAVD